MDDDDEFGRAAQRAPFRPTRRFVMVAMLASAVVSTTVAARPPVDGTAWPCIAAATDAGALAGSTWYIVGDRSKVGSRTFPADFTATLSIEAGAATFTLPCGAVALPVAVADGQLHFSVLPPGKLPGTCSMPTDIGLSLGELITRYVSGGAFTVRLEEQRLALIGGNGQGLLLSARR